MEKVIRVRKTIGTDGQGTPISSGWAATICPEVRAGITDEPNSCSIVGRNIPGGTCKYNRGIGKDYNNQVFVLCSFK